jgi:retinol dehydrogenase-12
LFVGVSFRGKVVVVSSCLHKLPKTFNFEDLMAEKNYEMFKVYGNSKLANVLFVKGLVARLKERNSAIKVYAVHPGCVRTEFTRGMSWFLHIGNMIATPVMMLLEKSASQGAAGVVHVAVDPFIASKNEWNGEYFFHGKLAPLIKAAKDKSAADKLWTISEGLTGCTWK